MTATSENDIAKAGVPDTTTWWTVPIRYPNLLAWPEYPPSLSEEERAALSTVQIVNEPARVQDLPAEQHIKAIPVVTNGSCDDGGGNRNAPGEC